MKKITTIFLAVLSGLVVASCDMSEDFKTYPFAEFGGSSTSVAENVGTIKIPVVLYHAAKKQVMVTVQGVDGTASLGKNYSISDLTSGVLTFEPGDSVKYVTVSIIDKPGVFTGTLAFSLKLSGATENVEISNGSTYAVTIKDNDHPLAEIIGTYTATATALTAKTGSTEAVTWTCTFRPYDGDVTRLWCDKIIPMFAELPSYGDGSIYCKVSSDKKRLSFPSGQTTSFNVGYGNQQILPCLFFNGEEKGYYTLDLESIDFVRADGGGVVFKAAVSGYCCIDKYVWTGNHGWLLGPKDGDEYQITFTKQQ